MAKRTPDFGKKPSNDSLSNGSERLEEFQTKLAELESQKDAIKARYEKDMAALDAEKKTTLAEFESWQNKMSADMRSQLGFGENKSPKNQFVIVSVPDAWVRKLPNPDKLTGHSQVAINLPSPTEKDRKKQWEAADSSMVYVDELRYTQKGKSAVIDFTDKSGNETFRYQERRGARTADGKRTGKSRITDVRAEEVADIILERTGRKSHFVNDREAALDAAAQMSDASASGVSANTSKVGMSEVVPTDVREKVAGAVDAASDDYMAYDDVPL